MSDQLRRWWPVAAAYGPDVLLPDLLSWSRELDQLALPGGGA